MEILMNIIERISSFLLTIEVTDMLDMAIIAYLVYRLLSLLRSTSSYRVLKGILVVLAALWISDALQFQALNFLLNLLVEIGVLALIILFQPEIRRILETVGSSRFSMLKVFSKPVEPGQIERAITETVEACAEMSKSRTGALIVFERENMLDEMLRSGTKLDAEFSSELLKNIFFVKAPMHDGAVIVRDGRILGAGCMLPLSRNVNLSRELGMRHRAGIGMSENSDAVVVLVSEETGSISVAVGGMLKRHLVVDTLEALLRRELMPPETTEKDNKKFSLHEISDLLKVKKEDEVNHNKKHKPLLPDGLIRRKEENKHGHE